MHGMENTRTQRSYCTHIDSVRSVRAPTGARDAGETSGSPCARRHGGLPCAAREDAASHTHYHRRPRQNSSPTHGPTHRLHNLACKQLNKDAERARTAEPYSKHDVSDGRSTGCCALYMTRQPPPPPFLASYVASTVAEILRGRGGGQRVDV